MKERNTWFFAAMARARAQGAAPRSAASGRESGRARRMPAGTVSPTSASSDGSPERPASRDLALARADVAATKVGGRLAQGARVGGRGHGAESDTWGFGS